MNGMVQRYGLYILKQIGILEKTGIAEEKMPFLSILLRKCWEEQFCRHQKKRRRSSGCLYSKHTGRMYKRNIQAIQYFFIHFFLEVVSFYVVMSYIRHDMIWMLALLYDFFAFVPQVIFGYFKDRGQN